METIALFDFDGTLTVRDSFFYFLRCTFSSIKLGQTALRNFLSLMGYTVDIVNNHEAKEKIFGSLFFGWEVERFQKACTNYTLSKMESIIRHEALEKAKWHMEMGHRVILASASIKDWLLPWAERIGFNGIIATEVEVSNGYLTGKFAKPNCYGQEKIRRFLELYPKHEQYELYMYGDSLGDRELLQKADYPFYRRFS